MKNILMLIFLASNFAFAESWLAVGKQNLIGAYSTKSACEAAESVVCFNTAGKDLRFHVVQTTQVDDLERPIYKTNYNVDFCDNADACSVLVEAKAATCTDAQGDFAQYAPNALLPGYSIYCSGIEGYEQKTVQDLVLDAALQEQILADDAVKQVTDNAVAQVMKAMNCGKLIQAIMAIRNVGKGLSPAQVSQFMQSFSNIKNLLDAGALVTAKAEVEAIVPDGTITTEADKTAIIAELVKCLQ